MHLRQGAASGTLTGLGGMIGTPFADSFMADEHASLLNSVLIRLGRNILLFQQIESGLKFILPYMHPKGSASGDDAFAKFRDKTHGQTLGKLAENFQESMRAETAILAPHLERMVEQRNQLVHHFHDMPGVSLLTVDGCRAAIQILDEQHREAQPRWKSRRSICRSACSSG
ncbi:protein of unknown function [Burkholderia multivorans]